eukprot:11208436-Lingulodinium_polyedra.AAC.1
MRQWPRAEQERQRSESLVFVEARGGPRWLPARSLLRADMLFSFDGSSQSNASGWLMRMWM